MADVWATVAEASEGTQAMLADAMELRYEDPVMSGLRDEYLSWLAPQPGSVVIEMGCGPGDVLRALADRVEAARAIGIDPSPVMIERAKTRHSGVPSMEFTVADARQTELPADSADVILFHTTLCHIPSPERALAEVQRILKPGGTLVVFDGDYATTPAALGPDDPVDGVIQCAMTQLVHNLYFCRTLPARITDSGLTLDRLEVLPYLAAGNAAFFVSLFTRGLRFLKDGALISDATAEGLLQELNSRIAEGRFFGFTSFHCAMAGKPGRPS